MQKDSDPPPPYEEHPQSGPSYPSSVATGHTDLDRFYGTADVSLPLSEGPVSPAVPPQHIVYVRGTNVHGRRYRRNGDRTPLLVREEERKFPIAALFFLLGWFIPPFWFFGACCVNSGNRYEVFWGRANLVMTIIILAVSLAGALGVAVAMGLNMTYARAEW